MLDLTGAEGAAKEITQHALPQLTQALHEALDRLERLLGRLDGATIVITLGKKEQ